MSSKSAGYQSSNEKNFIRQHFDFPLISNLSASKGKKLAYFGMPGEECLDIRDWHSVLREVAAVERNEKKLENMERLLRNRFKGIASRVYLGDVDNIILTGKGKERTIYAKPANTDVANDFDVLLDRAVWTFDIVYLDYFGRFLPRPTANHTKPSARQKRPQALRHLFDQERIDARHTWLLLLTVEGGQYSRADKALLTQYLENARITGSANLSDAIDFSLSRDDSTGNRTVKLVHGVMSIFVATAASSARLEVIPRGTVIYRGAKNHSMIHCAFQFARSPNVLGTASDPLALVRAPIIQPTTVDGETTGFSWATSRCPGATVDWQCDCLEFLESAYLPH